MQEDGSQRGWALVSEREQAAALLGAVVALEPDTEYSKSDLAEASGVTRKTLYLADVLEALVEVGVLDEVTPEDDPTDSQRRYRIRADSDVLAAARRFDEAVASKRSAPAAE